MRIMLTFCIQYKSSKTTYDLYTGQWFCTTYRLDFYGGGGTTYMRSNLRNLYVVYTVLCYGLQVPLRGSSNHSYIGGA